MHKVGTNDVLKIYRGVTEIENIAIGSTEVPVTSGDTPTYTPYVTIYFSNSSRTDYFPSGIIPDEEYRNEGGMIIAVEIGSGITSIGTTDFAYTFAGLSNMSSVTIGENVEYIGGRAFEDTGSLKAVTIPASVTGIGTNAFYNFDSSCTITFEGYLPTMSMSEEGDLGEGTQLIVPDFDFQGYCSSLHEYYCIVCDSDTGTTCGPCGTPPVPVQLFLYVGASRKSSTPIPDDCTDVDFSSEGIALRRTQRICFKDSDGNYDPDMEIVIHDSDDLNPDMTFQGQPTGSIGTIWGQGTCTIDSIKWCSIGITINAHI